ncbi:hypothetical protein CAPTEDRAFT_201720 [Capitella teleta]|uniref:ATP-dependent DNA helicase n=1 Tax=Capitella teleta TaxID=283909 RepID=R7UPC4_CAPTE|nr:hypothetical protein CAPTEDRAFT_201720 [Capitella teleta]|eukprot:ELU08035.1 hypothetical protein CAPTEDRAFT_201720 [Capitella teleta]
MTIQYRIQNDENFRRIEDELMRYDWSAISKGNTTPKVLALKVGSRVMLSQSVVASWQQFPLVLAYALTIHKAQGLEQPAVEADVQAMLGVEISRVISLDHLQILDNCKKSQEKMTIQYRIQNDENFRRIEDELMRYDWSAISKGNVNI